MIRFELDDKNYLYLARKYLKVIRRHVLHFSKRTIARMANVCIESVTRIEDLSCRIRVKTFEKILWAYVQALKAFGWRPIRYEDPQNV